MKFANQRKRIVLLECLSGVDQFSLHDGVEEMKISLSKVRERERELEWVFNGEKRGRFRN